VTPLLDIDDILAKGKQQTGTKAFHMARLHENGFSIPRTWCIPASIYEAYLADTGIQDRINVEINRKAFERMRWEEIWDVSLRIRSFFLNTPLPGYLEHRLEKALAAACNNFPVAVRSSAPGEDEKASSFAGLHDSFLNVTSPAAILTHVKLVWASLFSDAALLYRKELGLAVASSTMAVLIQELIPSDCAGVFFSLNPADRSQMLIEAVWGLNQGLVNGDVDPDRWHLDRATGRITAHHAPKRTHRIMAGTGGVEMVPLPPQMVGRPPLEPAMIDQVREAGRRLESFFGQPQDVEWTFCKDRFYVLQSRAITTSAVTDTDDKRTWYLSLHRSYDNLKALYDKIEHRLIPQMIDAAADLGRIDLSALPASDLCAEILRRQEIYDHWVKVYWADFIPFAHGIRLFGQIYNDAVRPSDPYEFMALLENTGLKSVRRNLLLEALAECIRTDPGLALTLSQHGRAPADHPFSRQLADFIDEFGDLSCTTDTGNECQYGDTAIIRILCAYARRPAKLMSPSDPGALEAAYLQAFAPERQAYAKDLLHLGRESFRLRDDDNIHLGRIEARLHESVQEGQARLSGPAAGQEDLLCLTKIPALAAGAPPAHGTSQDPVAGGQDIVSHRWFRARQIVGHPAGQGIAKGTARVILHPGDLAGFTEGEVLICQGVDPNMTFVIPLAAAVVEERGGMLIHGAIIAREYGLPCVTGADRILEYIHTGDRVTVDGYLGIVTCETDPF
jgi:rifampicin phosphotransferase